MFNNKLMLDGDFLSNELSLNLSLEASVAEAKYKEYYLNIIAAINSVYYLRPTIAQTQKYITDGNYYYEPRKNVICPSEKEEDSIYLFKYAQALPLKYDFHNGRANMLRGEKESLCKDSLQILDQLGLYQRNIYTR